MTVTGYVLRTALGVVLVGAGFAKLFDLGGFAETLAFLGVRPRKLLRPIAIAVVVTEITLGSLAISGLQPKNTDLAVVFLFGGFALTALVGIRRAPGVSCRCFGAFTSSTFGPRTLARNVCLLTAAVCAAVFEFQSTSPEARDWLLLLLAGIAVGVTIGQASQALQEMREGDAA